MLPLNANQTILEAISGSEGPITLGLLQILTPAAAAYAMAAGSSQSVVEVARFWDPLANKLKIDLSNNASRERLSNAFSSACRKLGIVSPDVSEMTWKNIAPMMAQASILHRWTEALRRRDSNNAYRQFWQLMAWKRVVIEQIWNRDTKACAFERRW